MTLGQERGHFLRAVMEGVAYSLKDCLGLIQELGIDAPEIIASGGATASPQWLQIQADIFEKPVRASRVKNRRVLEAVCWRQWVPASCRPWKKPAADSSPWMSGHISRMNATRTSTGKDMRNTVNCTDGCGI